MSQQDKMIARLKTKPKDYTFDEAKRLLESCGYNMAKTGKTGGSRVCFIKEKKVFRMHKPHPKNELLCYQVKELIDELRQEGLL
ncbi:MAG: type II toxin-antitoxin system HicA family toxin [Oscillospiraceae bacterium]|nr:type II toxin-antitoxin system HicA family toxin [Oscillospiraceae bacterium]